MNYYNEIKINLINNKIYKKVKDYSKNKNDLNAYYKVGKLLAEAGKHYGENIIRQYSEKLKSEVHKKYNTTLLKRIRKFYWVIEKGATMSHQLSWSHYVELLPIKNINEMNYYINQICINNIDIRTLRTIIKSKEYDRLSIETKHKLLKQEQLEVKDLIPNPIMIRNKNNNDVINEKILKKLILEDIDNFLLELGNDFSYVGSEFKIKLGNRCNFIDLLLYNIEFNCYAVVELKITELKKEHIGQIQVYMNYIDNNLKKFNQDKTIGIIICKQDNKYVIKYCSDDRILSREYELV